MASETKTQNKLCRILWRHSREAGAPAVTAGSGCIVDEPREGRIVDGVPYGKYHVAHVEMGVADLQFYVSEERRVVWSNIHPWVAGYRQCLLLKLIAETGINTKFQVEKDQQRTSAVIG